MSGLQNIRHIIFDLGGVLLNIDYSASARAFAELGVTDFDTRYSQLTQSALFDDLETGRLDRAAFLAAVRAFDESLNLSDQQIEEAWNAMLLDFPLRRLQLLQQLRGHYDLFLLSNTNEIHELAFNQILSGAHGLPSLATLFDRVYFSHRVGMRKPDDVIFQHILDENELRPEHTLFIDDSPQHIETAARLGIQTIWLKPGMTIEDDVFRPKEKASDQKA
jgi:putative hydrolase of the HAD superfamily